jgi:hypothetical protein
MALILARAILIASLMISCACTKALAQIPMIGLGGQRCGAWTANISSDSGGVGLLYQQWIYGFLSGLSSADARLLKDIDANAVKTWLDNYCANNSAELLVDAARAFASDRRR